MGVIYNIRKDKIKPINIIGLKSFRVFRVLYHVKFFKSYHFLYNKILRLCHINNYPIT